MLTAVYNMLRDGTFYQDLGADHFHRTSPQAQANRLVRQFAKLGFTCSLTPAHANPVSVQRPARVITASMVLMIALLDASSESAWDVNPAGVCVDIELCNQSGENSSPSPPCQSCRSFNMAIVASIQRSFASFLARRVATNSASS